MPWVRLNSVLMTSLSITSPSLRHAAIAAENGIRRCLTKGKGFLSSFSLFSFYIAFDHEWSSSSTIFLSLELENFLAVNTSDEAHTKAGPLILILTLTKL